MKYTNGKRADVTAFPFKGGTARTAKPGDSPLELEFESDKALSSGLQGAKMGAVLGPWGAVAGGVIGGAIGGLGGNFGQQTEGGDPGKAAATGRPETTKEKIARLKNQKINEKVTQEVEKEMASENVASGEQT